MTDDLSIEEVRRAADRVVGEVLEEAGVCEPPVDAVALARHLGLEVRPDHVPVRRGRPRPEPNLLGELSEELKQNFAAGELGEHLKAELLRALEIDPAGQRPMFGQSLARLIADRLLVPTDWLSSEARACGYDLLELGERFKTASVELIAWRLLDLDQPCAITVVDNGRVTRRRSNAYSVSKQLAPAESECLSQVQRYSRPCRVSQDGVDVRGWPVHGSDWKREILRSVADE